MGNEWKDSIKKRYQRRREKPEEENVLEVDPRDDLDGPDLREEIQTQNMDKVPEKMKHVIEEEPPVPEILTLKKEIKAKYKAEDKVRKPHVTEKKEVRIMWVLDGTLSFSSVFPAVYHMIEGIVGQIGIKKRGFKGVVMKYGLTVFRDDAESCEFVDEGYFTESEQKLLEKVREITFYGGNESGRENFIKGIDQAFCVLNEDRKEDTSSGLFLFSDSIPEEEDMEYDFENMQQDGYINYGLRFAQFYTYTEEYMPKVLIVDKDGNEVHGDKNYCCSYTLQDVLDEMIKDPETINKRVIGIVQEILKQVSINK